MGKAMQICMMCCAAPREIAGDVFLARAIDDNADLYQRRDFKIADLNSSAPWVQMARGINLKNVKNMAAQRKMKQTILRMQRIFCEQEKSVSGLMCIIYCCFCVVCVCVQRYCYY